MTPDVVIRERLLEDMRESGRRFVAAVREIPAERWPEGRYEEGWTAKDILAHVASIEWTLILSLCDELKSTMVSVPTVPG